MVVVLQLVGEIVVEGVGVAVAGAERFLVLVGRSVLHRGIVRDIVGGQTIEAVITLPVIFQTTFNLETKALDDVPVESRIGIPCAADPLGIIVGDRFKRRGVVTIVLLLVSALDRRGDRNRGVRDSVLETSVT